MASSFRLAADKRQLVDENARIDLDFYALMLISISWGAGVNSRMAEVLDPGGPFVFERITIPTLLCGENPIKDSKSASPSVVPNDLVVLVER